MKETIEDTIILILIVIGSLFLLLGFIFKLFM